MHQIFNVVPVMDEQKIYPRRGLRFDQPPADHPALAKPLIDETILNNRKDMHPDIRIVAISINKHSCHSRPKPVKKVPLEVSNFEYRVSGYLGTPNSQLLTETKQMGLFQRL